MFAGRALQCGLLYPSNIQWVIKWHLNLQGWASAVVVLHTGGGACDLKLGRRLQFWTQQPAS